MFDDSFLRIEIIGKFPLSSWQAHVLSQSNANQSIKFLSIDFFESLVVISLVEVKTRITLWRDYSNSWTRQQIKIHPHSIENWCDNLFPKLIWNDDNNRKLNFDVISLKQSA